MPSRWPGARRTSPGTSSPSVRPSGPGRRAARFRYPFRGALQLRQAPDSRLGAEPAAQRFADGLPDTDIEETYGRLERWTEYWLGRRAAGSPLPHYHHGNDSGWDNATTFDVDRVVESADLAAFLILQMRELADLAARLGKPDAGTRWHSESQRLLSAMLSLLWTGERFGARIVGTGELRTSKACWT